MTYTPAIQRCKNCDHTYIQHEQDLDGGVAGACKVDDCVCQGFDQIRRRPDIPPQPPITMVPSTPTVVGMTNPQAALLAAAFSISTGFEDAIEMRAHKFEAYLDLRDSIRKEKDL